MIARRGAAHKKHELRVAWLSARFAQWADVPGINDNVTDANRPRLDALWRAMLDAGLFGASTVQAQREAVRRLVADLRAKNAEAER